MKKKKELFGIYLPIFAIILIAVTTIRTVACFLHFDTESGIFIPKGLISTSDYMTVAASLFYFTYIFTAKKDRRLIPSFTSASTYIPTGLTAAALLFFAKAMLDKAIDTKEASRALTIPIILSFAVSIFAVLSIVHFVLTALDEKNHSGDRAKFGLFTVMLLAFYACYLYFDTTLPLNSLTKITDQMAYLFAAIFFLYETRLSLGREKWRGYIAYGFIAATLTAYSSIPSIIIYMANGNVISNSIYESLLTFTLFVFITARILLTGELIEDIPSPIVESLIEAADARSAAITPIEEKEAESEPLENQITIEEISGEKLEEYNIGSEFREVESEEDFTEELTNDFSTNGNEEIS